MTIDDGFQIHVLLFNFILFDFEIIYSVLEFFIL